MLAPTLEMMCMASGAVAPPHGCPSMSSSIRPAAPSRRNRTPSSEAPVGTGTSEVTTVWSLKAL